MLFILYDLYGLFLSCMELQISNNASESISDLFQRDFLKVTDYNYIIKKKFIQYVQLSQWYVR